MPQDETGHEAPQPKYEVALHPPTFRQRNQNSKHAMWFIKSECLSIFYIPYWFSILNSKNHLEVMPSLMETGNIKIEIKILTQRNNGRATESFNKSSFYYTHPFTNVRTPLTTGSNPRPGTVKLDTLGGTPRGDTVSPCSDKDRRCTTRLNAGISSITELNPTRFGPPDGVCCYIIDQKQFYVTHQTEYYKLNNI